tara:strand:- start:1107 stop:2594 length:1488 start_codon:yes stop_codon:yes gene_type:complete
MDAILAIDQGTTSTKGITFTTDGELISSSRSPVRQIYPDNGWVEQNPTELLNSVLSVLTEEYQKAKTTGIQILSVGITNQRETTIIWDKHTGQPIYNAVVWQDRRTADFIQTLKNENLEEQIKAKTGLMLDPYFSASKILWILDNVPNARNLSKQGRLLFGTVDTYLIWKLTNGEVHATDVTNASRTSLFNLHTLTWDDDLLDIYNIPGNVLPSVKKCTDHFGDISRSIVGQSLPIYGVAGDQQAALVGQSCFEEGQVKSTYGTGCFALVNTGDKILKSDNNLITTISYQIQDTLAYGLEGSIFIAGASSDWLSDNLGIIEDYSQIEDMCRSTADDHNVYMVPAFTGLGAPWWEPNTRAAIYGLTRQTTRNAIVRAAVESVAYQTNDLIAAMARDGVDLSVMRVDGGMVANQWFLQFLANITRLQIQRPFAMESTSLGAAMLSGLGYGVISSLQDISNNWNSSYDADITMHINHRDQLTHRWTQAVKATIAYHSE